MLLTTSIDVLNIETIQRATLPLSSFVPQYNITDECGAVPVCQIRGRSAVVDRSIRKFLQNPRLSLLVSDHDI